MVRVTTQCVFSVFSGLSALIWPPSSTALLGTGGVRAGGFRMAGCVAGQCAHVAVSQAVESL